MCGPDFELIFSFFNNCKNTLIFKQIIDQTRTHEWYKKFYAIT